MPKRYLFALIGLALAMVVAEPAKAQARVFVSVTAGAAVYVEPGYDPAYSYEYARPYYPPTYYLSSDYYSPAYVYPHYVYSRPYYGGYYRQRWSSRRCDYRRPIERHGYYRRDWR